MRAWVQPWSGNQDPTRCVAWQKKKKDKKPSAALDAAGLTQTVTPPMVGVLAVQSFVWRSVCYKPGDWVNRVGRLLSPVQVRDERHWGGAGEGGALGRGRRPLDSAAPQAHRGGVPVRACPAPAPGPGARPTDTGDHGCWVPAHLLWAPWAELTSAGRSPLLLLSHLPSNQWWWIPSNIWAQALPVSWS